MGGLFSKQRHSQPPTQDSRKMVRGVTVKEEFMFHSKNQSSPDESLKAMIMKNAPYVGTIILSNGDIGTACLLKDGRVLTCLHVILDYESSAQKRNLKIIDFSTAPAVIVFTKNSKVYCYNIRAIGDSGFNTFYNCSASTPASFYDYAFLTIDGNALDDLGGGFTLDPASHFSSAFVTDPTKTLAISGPRVAHNEDGQLYYVRHCSCAENAAAQGGYYCYQQLGNHYAAEGFSGQAILPIGVGSYLVGNSILYALHSYLDRRANQRAGIKISEFIRETARQLQPETQKPGELYNNFLTQLMQIIEPEVLRKASVNKLTGAVTPGEIVDTKTAIELSTNDSSDIIADKQSEARKLGKIVWGQYGDLIGPEQHQATGKPHFHDADRYAYSHIFFYPPANEQDKYFKPASTARK
jgi:hypothetical protein